jgi:uncharacterized protein YjeT (DUF2065 family)
LKISTILSWINMIVWGLIVAFGILNALAFGSFPLVVIFFLFSFVILHSYAAFQLQKSIKNPAIPLSSQTPVGLRFVGFIALFFGLTCVANGITIIQGPAEAIKLMQDQFPQAKDAPIANVRIAGIIVLFMGLSVAVNVFLNFRLLRWYRFMQDDEKPK